VKQVDLHVAYEPYFGWAFSALNFKSEYAPFALWDVIAMGMFDCYTVLRLQLKTTIIF